MPPHRVSSFTLGMFAASLRIALLTWSASSRVGQSTSACSRIVSTSSACSRLKPNAAVLPLPVCACAITSQPSSIGGKLCACTGVMSV